MKDDQPPCANTQSAQEQTTIPLKRRIMQYLDDHGFRPDMDHDGDITFLFEGNRHYVRFDNDDENYLQLFRGFNMDEDDLHGGVERANEANRTVKFAKTSIHDGVLTESIEMLVFSDEHFNQVFLRMLGALQTAIHTYVEQAAE